MKPEIGKYYYVLCTREDGSISNECGVSRCDGHLSESHSLMWCMNSQAIWREPNEIIISEAPAPEIKIEKEYNPYDAMFSDMKFGFCIAGCLLLAVLFLLGLFSMLFNIVK